MTVSTQAIPAEASSTHWGGNLGLFAGPILAFIMLMAGAPEGMSAAAWKTSALAVWMATWWISEAMPLPVTSLLPIVILPTFGIMPLSQTLAPFSSSIIYLFFGGFVISAAMQKWNLHVRIALRIVKLVGCGPRTILGGLMLATCFLAFWISNSATVIMMLPVALSISVLLTEADGSKQSLLKNTYAKALMLGIAYSAAVGGLGTFVGTPTNAILQGHLEKTYNYSLSLADWMMFGVPTVIIIGLLAWVMLVVFFVREGSVVKGAKDLIHGEYAKLGRMSRGEKNVAAVFAMCVALWALGDVLEGFIGITIEDAVVAVFGAFVLFLIPTDARKNEFTMTWKDAERIPWGVLVFFGGSLSLSGALTETGVTAWLSQELSMLHGLSLVLIVIAVVTLIVIVSELMSNVATITAFLPILSALAAGLNVNPLLILVPATLAASCGFMMPGASAANALAFSTGYLRAKEMVRAGFLLDLVCVAVIVGITFTLMAAALGIEAGVVPEWAVIPAK